MIWRHYYSSDDEEIDREGAGCYLSVFAVVLFLVSTYLTWQEFRYAVFSKKTVADVVSIDEVEVGSRRRRHLKLVVKYQFTDESTQQVRTGSDQFSLGTAIADREEVQYFPGPAGGSRMRKSAQSWPIIVFLATLAVAGYAFWRLYREANESAQPRKRRRRKRKPRTE